VKPAEEEKKETDSGPPEGTSTLGLISYFAFGPVGLEVMDIIMTILLLGIVISYLSAVISFLADTPLSIGPLGDAIVVASCMAILSLVPDLGHLSGVSGIGLAVLAATFVIIAWYGIWTESSQEADVADVSPSLPLWPTSKTGLSHFFGVSVFGFGVVPLTYNFQESMRHPKWMVHASAGALTLVALCYIALGVGLSLLFTDVQGEVMHELPTRGWLPTTTRLAMALVVILTAPLLIVPTGELLEGKFQGHAVLVRCGVCAVGVCVAVLLPSFVQVLAFVGCACVGFVSFVVPAVLHLRLLWTQHQSSDPWSSITVLTVVVDLLMLLWGIVATILGTIYTIK
jgi:proton-coupled amino acid transporter